MFDSSATESQFQSTLPRRERLRTHWEICGRWRFNPRSREGSDIFLFPPTSLPPVSIHAPAKGATGETPCGDDWSKSFNPRSREGSDKCGAFFVHCFCCFNPRSREGSDVIQRRPALPDKVSIHAPAKGATENVQSALESQMFQSTLPRRERQKQVECGLTYMSSFNPRSREGSNVGAVECQQVSRIVSIHAPAKGATGDLGTALDQYLVSIHAPAKGATVEVQILRF